MNPTEFVVLANKLSADAAEASQRSAVSRAYYGAMHEARILIESCGFRFDIGEVHKKLHFCMAESGDAELIAAGRLLDSLRGIRNDADYDLDDEKFRKKAFVAIQMATARNILTTVSSARGRVASFRQAVRKYAKFLGKTLSGAD
jgi:uncharacterized protein (UPF0332 family)